VIFRFARRPRPDRGVREVLVRLIVIKSGAIQECHVEDRRYSTICGVGGEVQKGIYICNLTMSELKKLSREKRL
jgi:hypothetical protein